MSRVVYTIITLLLLLMSPHARAQDSSRQGVVLHEDPRLSILLKKNHTTEPVVIQDMAPTRQYVAQPSVIQTPVRPHVVLYKGKGFRVQIYNGPDREKAIKIKTEFMRHFPGVHTYLTYISPSFRIKVGDYRDRSDAAGMMREANSMYSPCMIVPDMVTVTNY